MDRSIRTRVVGSRHRAAIALAVSALLPAGVLVATVAASSFGGKVTAATTQTRFVSCATTDFQPFDSGTTFTIGSARVLYRTSGDGGDNFRCNPNLPHKAVVTKLQVTGADYGATSELGVCSLLRWDMRAPTAGEGSTMASVGPTGFAPTPGAFRLSDTTISLATIDNSKYAYTVACDLEASDANAGVIGATVTYTIAPGDG